MVHYCIFDPGVKINVPSQVYLKDTGRLNIGTFDDRYVIFLAIFSALYDVGSVPNIDGLVLPIYSPV